MLDLKLAEATTASNAANPNEEADYVVMIQFRQGEIQSITVTTRELEPLLVIYRRKRYVKMGLIAATPYGVEFFRMNYTTLARRQRIPIQDLLKAAGDDLMANYRLRFNWLMYGEPGIFEYQGNNWFTVGGRLAMSLEGICHDQLSRALIRNDISIIRTDRLLEYVQSYYQMVTEGIEHED